MSVNHSGPSELDPLRSEAEARLGARESKRGDSAGGTAYELELHRLELEMQDQSLRELRAEAESALSRLAEINLRLEDLVAVRTEQLESALRKAERKTREKSRFLSTMSHELRTPLNAIMGMTGLATRLAVDPEQQRYLGIVERSLRDLQGIINDIVDISRIEAGSLCLRETHFTLDYLIESVESLMVSTTSAKEVHLAFELPQECAHLPLAGDAVRLNQVLINLVGNAAKFTERGSIHVRCMPVAWAEHELWIRFEIEDTGPGIGAEDQKRLFVPFEQLDGSITRTHGGSGLGLAISKELVTAMGGRSG